MRVQFNIAWPINCAQSEFEHLVRPHKGLERSFTKHWIGAFSSTQRHQTEGLRVISSYLPFWRPPYMDPKLNKNWDVLFCSLHSLTCSIWTPPFQTPVSAFLGQFPLKTRMITGIAASERKTLLISASLHSYFFRMVSIHFHIRPHPPFLHFSHNAPTHSSTPSSPSLHQHSGRDPH